MDFGILVLTSRVGWYRHDLEICDIIIIVFVRPIAYERHGTPYRQDLRSLQRG